MSSPKIGDPASSLWCAIEVGATRYSCAMAIFIARPFTSDYPDAVSDDLARVYRFDVAQDSEMISPTIPI